MVADDEDFAKSRYEPLKAIIRITIITITRIALLIPELESNFLNKSHPKFSSGKSHVYKYLIQFPERCKMIATVSPVELIDCFVLTMESDKDGELS